MKSSRTLLMGVLNVTPDSFVDGGLFLEPEDAIARAREIEALGADILDVGGASSRPNAAPITEEEELRRILPVLTALNLTIPIAVDTWKPRVAEQALLHGASIINDITGFRDPAMRALAAGCEADLCLMHMAGSAENMHFKPDYPAGVVDEVLRFFETQIALLVKEGVRESRIILDPGVGFGKTTDQIVTLIKEIKRFKSLGLRVMVGASRKFKRVLDKPPSDLLAATLAAHTFAILNGVDILRVHDIQEHRDALDLIALLH